MAYTKQTWATGDVITEEKLNHIEDGIANAGGSLVLTEDENGTLNHTWEEIQNALMSGKLVGMAANIEVNTGIFVTRLTIVNSVGMYSDSNEYIVTVGEQDYMANSPTGYPAKSFG